MVPSVFTPHAIVEPTLTEMKVPAGGASLGLGHQVTTVPSAFMRYPQLIMTNGPVGGVGAYKLPNFSCHASIPAVRGQVLLKPSESKNRQACSLRLPLRQ
jgi:hypothetical protein